MNIRFEKDVLDYLNLPKLPVKEWDGQSPFDKGVAVVKLAFDEKAYAVATYNPEKDAKPRIVKVFASETFYDIDKVFIVPPYMDVEHIENADLDDESKKHAEELAKQAREIEDEGTGDGKPELPTDKPYYFDNINNDEEARAFIKAYNEQHKIGGRIPANHDTILMRLAVLYAELNKGNDTADDNNDGNVETPIEPVVESPTDDSDADKDDAEKGDADDAPVGDGDTADANPNDTEEKTDE